MVYCRLSFYTMQLQFPQIYAKIYEARRQTMQERSRVMFSLFGKKKVGKSEEEKHAESLARTKKVQFEPMKISEAEALLAEDMRAVLEFVPVNYYATKNSYLLCTFFYEEDYSEIWMRFEYRVDDLPRGKSRMYQIDKVLMRDILRRFGVNINI